MRRILALATLAAALAGCSTVKGWFGLGDQQPPAPPAEVPKQGALSTIGEDIDKADSRVAAAVTVAVENKDKPAVVEAEGKVALGYLPKPDEGDVAIARARAAKADPAAYAAEVAGAKAFVAKVEADWAEAVKASKRNAEEVDKARREVKAAGEEVAKLKAEVARVEAEASRNVWTLAGVGLGVVGALCTAFLGPRIGLPLLASGALLGSVPFVYSSPWFSYLLGGTLAFAALMFGWYVWDKTRDAVNASDDGQK